MAEQEDPNPRAVPGGNEPPSDLDIFISELAERGAKIRKRIDLLAERVFGRIKTDDGGPVLDDKGVPLFEVEPGFPEVIPDEKAAEAVTEFLAQLSTAKDELDAFHKAEKEPWLLRGRAVDAFKNNALAVFERADTVVRGRFKAYAKRKQEAREEAEVLEAARVGIENVQPSTTAESTRVRSARGSSAGLTDFWTYEIKDPAKVPRAYCSPDPAKIKKAIKEGARDIKGLRIFEDSRVTARK